MMDKNDAGRIVIADHAGDDALLHPFGMEEHPQGSAALPTTSTEADIEEVVEPLLEPLSVLSHISHASLVGLSERE